MWAIAHTLTGATPMLDISIWMTDPHQLTAFLKLIRAHWPTAAMTLIITPPDRRDT